MNRTGKILALGSAATGAALVLLWTCKSEPTYREIVIPPLPDSEIVGTIREYGEGYSLFLYKNDPDDAFPLKIDYCNNVDVYWADPKRLVVSYEEIDIFRFTSPRRYFGGARVTICAKDSGECPKPAGSVVSLPKCVDSL